jgi:hypothetical protein
MVFAAWSCKPSVHKTSDNVAIEPLHERKLVLRGGHRCDADTSRGRQAGEVQILRCAGAGQAGEPRRGDGTGRADPLLQFVLLAGMPRKADAFVLANPETRIAALNAKFECLNPVRRDSTNGTTFDSTPSMMQRSRSAQSPGAARICRSNLALVVTP